MNVRRLPIFVLMLLAMSSLACGLSSIPWQASATPVPSLTNTPTSTVTASSTLTPSTTPTRTPFPTATPKIVPTPSLDESIHNLSGGNALQPALGHKSRLDAAETDVTSPFGLEWYSFGTTDVPTYEVDYRIIMSWFLDSFFASRGIVYATGEPFLIQIGPLDGLGITMAWEEGPSRFRGEAAVVKHAPDRLFVAWALTDISYLKHSREDTGQPTFQAMLSSVDFDNIEMVAASCPGSVDADYGFNAGNPIRTGGGSLAGPALEEDYLDGLADPDGQRLSFRRMRSLSAGNTILDESVLTYEGMQRPLRVFVDQYSYAAPLAPRGFSCRTRLPAGPGIPTPTPSITT